MTNTQTQPTNERPSDEVVTRIVAVLKPKWYAIRYQPSLTSINNEAGFFDEDWDNEGKPDNWYPDPRSDSDAALELLGWAVERLEPKYQGPLGITFDSGGWCLVVFPPGSETKSWFIPISGPEFCYAVVRLAAQCLGVEDE